MDISQESVAERALNIKLVVNYNIFTRIANPDACEWQWSTQNHHMNVIMHWN